MLCVGQVTRVVIYKIEKRVGNYREIVHTYHTTENMIFDIVT